MSKIARVAVLLFAGCAAPMAPPAEPPESTVAIPVVAPVETAPPALEEPEVPAPEALAAENRTESGITWTVIQHGTGTVHPGINDSVEVHYTGWTADGEEFDSSVKRGKPAQFGVSAVIKGWTEVLQLMVRGDRWRIVIPAELAYGHAPERRGPPAGDLTFEVELLDIFMAPAVPADVAAPPANATVTPSGLAYVVLRTGVGQTHPTGSDKVEVHYSGWTTDGKMFDSSVTRNKTAKFGLNGVIKGWTEALQLMRAGDVFRVWIPADLAYGNTPKRPGMPTGTLVFDIELFAIHP